MATDEPGAGGPNWPRWFLVVGFLLGTATVMATPAFRGPDEFTQVMRMATIDRGFVIPPSQSSNPDGYRVDGCLNTYAFLAFNRTTYVPPPHWGSQFDRYACGPPYVPRAHGASKLGNTEVNPPVPYVPALIGFNIGRALGGATWSYMGARFAQMLAYVLLVWFALRLLPWGRPFLFAVALIPAAMQLSATISADPVTNGLAFVIIAATLRLIDRSHRTGQVATWPELGAYGLAIVLFALTKPAAVFGSLRRRIVVLASTPPPRCSARRRLDHWCGVSHACRDLPRCRQHRHVPMDPVTSRRVGQGGRTGVDRPQRSAEQLQPVGDRRNP